MKKNKRKTKKNAKVMGHKIDLNTACNTVFISPITDPHVLEIQRANKKKLQDLFGINHE